MIQVKKVDGSTYEIVDSQMRMLHGSMDYNDQVGTISSGSITGDLSPADHGSWYLVIDYGTNNTCWLDEAETIKDPYVKRVFGADGDQDGFEEHYVELYFSGLGPLKAGEDKKEVEIKLAHCPARTSSISFSSLTNASSISTSAYAYYTATGYMGGFTEGDLGTLAKVILNFSSTYASYPDSEYWKLVHLKLGSKTFTSAQFGSYDLSNKRYQIKFGDQINHHGGLDFYYPKNAGDLWASYELKAYCKYPSASKNVNVTMQFFFYKPDGTLTSAFMRSTLFAS